MSKTRRANGEGYLTKVVKNGVLVAWRGQIDLGGQRYYRRGKTQSAVADKLKALKRDYDRGQIDLSGKHTVRTYLDGWMEERMARVNNKTLKLRSLEADERNVRLHILPELGDIQLRSLTVTRVSKWHQQLRRKGLAKSSADQAHRTLRNALNVATVRGLVSVNPAGPGSWPQSADQSKRRESLSEEQGKRLVAAVSRPDARLDFGPARALSQLHGGLRQGEALGLQWPDIDLDKGMLTIFRILQRPTFRHGPSCEGKDGHTPGRCPVRIPGPTTGTPKSLKGQRMVPLSADTVAALSELRREVMARKLRLGTAWVDDTPWVFPGELGQKPDIRADSRRWKALVEKTLGQGAPTGTHAARRHAATRWASRGVPQAVTMSAFGWTRADMLDLYTSIEAEALREAARLVDGLT